MLRSGHRMMMTRRQGRPLVAPVRPPVEEHQVECLVRPVAVDLDKFQVHTIAPTAISSGAVSIPQ
jgi:hypothetical protein